MTTICDLSTRTGGRRRSFSGTQQVLYFHFCVISWPKPSLQGTHSARAQSACQSHSQDCASLLSAWLTHSSRPPCLGNGAAHSGLVLPYQLTWLKQLPIGMPTDQPQVDKLLLRSSSQVILGCVWLTSKSNHSEFEISLDTWQPVSNKRQIKPPNNQHSAPVLPIAFVL